MLISPYVGQGIVEHDGRNNGGVYTHTSWLNFAANLWGLKGLDNPRIKWSATFEHLISSKARFNTPQTLPMAINPEDLPKHGK
jgi:phospholipase C